MANSIQNKSHLSIEELFEYATEDINAYLQAAQSWSNPPEGYTYGYLLTLILSNRARGRLAFGLMGKRIPEEYVTQRKQLETLWKEAEGILAGQIFNNVETLHEIISGEFKERIDDLKNALYEVRHIAQDGDLIDNPECVAEDLENVASNFLLHFQDMYLTRKELNKTSLKTDEYVITLQKRFDEIEGNFKKYFGYFHSVADFLSNMKKREYNMDTWWFTSIPERDKFEEKDIPENVMKKFWDMYKSTSKITAEDCPDKEKIIAYALGELSSTERLNIRRHALKCRLCLDLIMDVRYAESVSKEAECDKASEEFFKEVRARLLKEDAQVIKEDGHQYAPCDDVDMVKFLIRAYLAKEIYKTRIRALARRPLYEEAQIADNFVFSAELENVINLRLKIDDSGKYTLPRSPEKEFCDPPDAYREINEFIKIANIYWAGFARKSSGEIRKFNPKLITGMSLASIDIKIDQNEQFKSLIIGIAWNEEELVSGLKALEGKDEKAISSLNIKWLICTLE